VVLDPVGLLVTIAVRMSSALSLMAVSLHATTATYSGFSLLTPFRLQECCLLLNEEYRQPTRQIFRGC